MVTLTLCRFAESGVLCKHDIDIEDNAYFAISHVWAEVQWRHNIPNIPWEVLASPQKADFLGTKLKALVGNQYFWMDILCVDQRSEDARVGVVRHIPGVYRRAEKTIVIRESGGFMDCCAQAIHAKSATWTDGGQLSFQHHMNNSHRFEPLVETWFNRLWVLQEAILSETLEFTVCGQSRHEEIDPFDDLWGCVTRGKNLKDHLQATAYAWITYGIGSDGEDWEYDNFVSAFLHLGTVTRRAVSVDRHRRRSPHAEIQNHSNSVRETSKPRDFILAILPQYGWYIPPPNVRTLDFGALWVDCCAQAQTAGSGYDFYPRITKGMVGDAASGDDSRRPTAKIPEPQCLGDFVKLFGTQKDEPETLFWGLKVSDVDLEYVEPGNLPLTLEIIRDSMDFSHEPWFFGIRGDLTRYGSFPRALPSLSQLYHVSSQTTVRHDECVELDEEVEALKALSAMWLGIFEERTAVHGDWNYYREWLNFRVSNSYAETLMRITALVSCGSGASALAWSRNYLTPVVATVKGHRMLALLSNRFLESLEAKEEERSTGNENKDRSEACDKEYESKSSGMTKTGDITTASLEQLLTKHSERPKEAKRRGEEGRKKEVEGEREENEETDGEEEEEAPESNKGTLCFCAQRSMSVLPRNLVLVEQQTGEVVGTIPDFVDFIRSPEENAQRNEILCMNGERRLLVDFFRGMNTVVIGSG